MVRLPVNQLQEYRIIKTVMEFIALQKELEYLLV